MTLFPAFRVTFNVVERPLNKLVPVITYSKTAINTLSLTKNASQTLRPGGEEQLYLSVTKC